jgi:tetratricopeptide (TPR) repeat protein
MGKKICVVLSLAILVIFANCARQTAAPHSQETAFPKAGRWKIEGEDSKRWTGDLVIQEVDGKEFTGYFDWYYSSGEEYVGREKFRGVYDAKSRKVVITGYNVTNTDKLALGTYQASLDKNGSDFVSGIWGGEGTPPDYGGWSAKFQTEELTPGVQEYLYKASSYFQDDKLDDAIKNADEVIRLTRGVGDEAAKAFAIRAVSYIGKRNYSQAVEDFTSVIKTIPDARMYLARGMTYVEMENYDLAIEDFNTAIRIDADAGMYLERAKAHLYKKEYDKAVEDADTEIRMYSDESDMWEAYVIRSIAYTEKGNSDQAKEDFDNALSMEEGEQAKLYNTRAWIYAHFFKKEFDRAIEDASQAIKLRPKEAAYYDTRGWAYLGKGDYNSASDNFTKALQLDPDLFESKDGLKTVREARAAAPAE